MSLYRKIQKYLFIAFVAIIAFGLLYFVFYGQDVSVATIYEFAAPLGIWLPIYFILLYILASIFFPTTPFMAMAGFIFGFKFGLLYTTIAGFVSAFITFYISRELGRSFIDEILSIKFLDSVEKLDEKIARHGVTTVMVLRILPIMPFNVLNLLMGVSKVRTRDYALGTLVGLAPSNVIAVYLGSLIVSVLQ
jgi:phospholipase D1/2